VKLSAWRNENKSVRRRKAQILVTEARTFTEENDANKERELLSSFPSPARGNGVYRSCLRFNSMPARVHPLDYPVPDGLERLRRDGAEAQWLFMPEPDTRNTRRTRVAKQVRTPDKFKP
jgi:hypothetical protein